MNIYIHCEVYDREFDSKLLLAIYAASRGHEVIISDIEGIEKGISRGLLAPGIFHTKSLTPTQKKINRHEKFLKAGFKITSIDEEGGLVTKGYDNFALRRYSNQTLEMCSAVFAWGSEDFETLKRVYPKHSSKIYKTGSPRADLWKPIFSNFHDLPRKFFKNPYILISSNLGYTNSFFPFHDYIKSIKKSDYHKRDPNIIYTAFGLASEQYRITSAFIEAIQYLAKNYNGYDIVLRPHPSENINSWKTYLDGIPNVYVIRDGPINNWVSNSFVVMHNGCTTAYEAVVSKKPLISYVPFSLKYGNDLPNELGHIVSNKYDLLDKINKIFNNNSNSLENDLDRSHNKKFYNKIYIDDKEMSAEKILNIWEKIDISSLSKSNNWLIYSLFLKLIKLNGNFNRIFKKFFFNNQSIENNKFSKLNSRIISKKIKNIKTVLKIKKEFDYKILSDRTILIKSN